MLEDEQEAGMFAFDVTPPPGGWPRRRFTGEEVARMVELGILAEVEPLELIDGELITVSPQGPQHVMLTVRVHRALERAFGRGHFVQDHSPIAAGPDSQPEPDVAVVRGEVEAFDRLATGADLALVVEVAVTSQKLDRAKLAVYGRANVPEYWLLDVPDRRLYVYTEPAEDGYRTLRIHTDADAVAVAGTTLHVSELLP
jgi:Uma2 family endonuclease